MSSGKCAIGTVWGGWTVIGLIPDHKNPKARCRCVCGAIREVQRGGLVSGHSRSCGCLKAALKAETRPSHGKVGTRVYKVWTAMIGRCSNPTDQSFQNYGARGIRVEWDSFESFYADMGDPPEGALIERKNTNGNYSKANCVWAGWAEQASNKRVSRRWQIHGVEFRTSREAAKFLGILPCQVNRRANGYMRRGKFHPPWEGYSSVPLYAEDGTKYEPKAHEQIAALAGIPAPAADTYPF